MEKNIDALTDEIMEVSKVRKAKSKYNNVLGFMANEISINIVAAEDYKVGFVKGNITDFHIQKRFPQILPIPDGLTIIQALDKYIAELEYYLDQLGSPAFIAPNNLLSCESKIEDEDELKSIIVNSEKGIDDTLTDLGPVYIYLPNTEVNFEINDTVKVNKMNPSRFVDEIKYKIYVDGSEDSEFEDTIDVEEDIAQRINELIADGKSLDEIQVTKVNNHDVELDTETERDVNVYWMS